MSHQPDESPIDRLVEQFRSLLDESLIVAIAGDHDLSTGMGYSAAETTLKELSQDVALEEATGFDPSGALGIDHHEDVSASSREASQSRQTATSSTDASSNQADLPESMPVLTKFDTESEDSKLASLRSMFDDLKDFDIQHSLKKAKGNFQTALDDLLHIQYLQSTGQFTRGIDGFFVPDEGISTGKRKNKKNAKVPTISTANFDIDSTTAEVLEKNQVKQLKHQDEIAYLADRINMPFDAVSDVYYRKKCSSGAAAVDMLETYVALGITSEDETSKAQAKQLASEFRNVPDRFLLALVQVTASSTSAANDIAVILSNYFAKNPWTQRLDLSHRLTPLPNEDLEGALGSLSPGGKARTPGSARSSRPTSVVSTSGTPDWSQTFQSIASSNQAKHEASAYASQLSRRGGGGAGGLYKQAAVVYRERAQDHARYAQTMTSTAADALVERTSTPTSVDLHGITVRDGTRIARSRVHNWWNNLGGEFRARKAKETPFTVVTGVRRHSVGGVSQLRQAVAAALLQDGWKMQVETGKFVVSGRR